MDEKASFFRCLISLVTFAASANLAFSQSSIESGRAQVEMEIRINSFVSKYAAKIGVNDDLQSYCKTKMNYETAEMAKHKGMWPFGYNYNISRKDELFQVIDLREKFEKIYLQLCLANAKKLLTDAEK
jgi:hypothetical protein